MKHPLFSVFLIFIVAGNLRGQDNPFSFSLNLGANLSNAKEYTNIYYGVGQKKTKMGFQLGVNVEYAIANGIYLQSGLSVTEKGTKHEGAELWIGGTGITTYWERTTNQIYLQMPIHLGYKVKISNLTKIYVNAGPYIGYGIGGKETVKERTTPSSIRQDEKFVSETFTQDRRRYSPYNFKREDFGVSFGLGVEYRKIVLGLNYELGLSNISKPNKDEISPLPVDYRNRNLSLTVGYIF